ncbi:MAG: RpoL/Rpb11 RNA polymerase subunit family protein [Thermoplasmata archaeon]|nr:RpoL/Rpb11 RNA polymerase subunit family protein [Thermoplasmata archaeon]
MQTYLVEKTDDSITLGFKDANLTLITPLMKALDTDDAVELVRYIDTHPELDDRKLFVKVRSGDPAEAVERASQSVADYYASIKE